MLTTFARHRADWGGLDFQFAVCFEGRLKEELLRAKMPVHPLRPVRVRNPLSIWRARRDLTALLDREPFDVAVTHSPWSQIVLGPAVRRRGLPLVYWQHDVMTGRHWLEKLARRVRPDLVIVNSDFTATTTDHLYPNEPRQVVHCPVTAPAALPDADARQALRAELHCSPSETVIIQVSRLEEMKGHRTLLTALGRMKAIPGWACWMVGGAQRPHEVAYRAQLESLAEREGIRNRVRFLGQRSDVPRLLAAADVFCQTNLGPESFGLTFIEALYAQLPVVTTALGGACEIINDTCGALVPPNDPVAVANALERLVRDPAQRARLGANGPPRARHLCDPPTQLGKLTTALELLLGRESAKHPPATSRTPAPPTP